MKITAINLFPDISSKKKHNNSYMKKNCKNGEESFEEYLQSCSKKLNGVNNKKMLESKELCKKTMPLYFML